MFEDNNKLHNNNDNDNKYYLANFFVCFPNVYSNIHM